MFYNDFCFYLSKLQCIIASSNTLYVSILGDFNENIQSTSISGAELIDFCDNIYKDLCFVDRERLLPDTFTYLMALHVHHGWTTVLLRCQVNLSYLMYQLLIMLYVLTIFHCVLK